MSMLFSCWQQNQSSSIYQILCNYYTPSPLPSNHITPLPASPIPNLPLPTPHQLSSPLPPYLSLMLLRLIWRIAFAQCDLLFVKEKIIMLKQQQDPLAECFQEGVEVFVHHVKERPEEHKTRGQKNKERIAKVERIINDPQLKKKRNHQRRQAEKKKITSIIATLSQQEAKKFALERKKAKEQGRQKAIQGMLHGQAIMVDLVFESRMNGKENRSLGKQIELITQAVKKADNPPSLHLCSYGGGIQPQLERMGIQHWHLATHTENIAEVAAKLGKRPIYLSPDAEKDLETVEDDCCYILGGLIDRTIIKYASLHRAYSLGIEARKLPIKEFMRSRICLNLDHVVMMVLKFKQTGDWKTAFSYAAPKRWKRELWDEFGNDISKQQKEKPNLNEEGKEEHSESDSDSSGSQEQK